MGRDGGGGGGGSSLLGSWSLVDPVHGSSSCSAFIRAHSATHSCTSFFACLGAPCAQMIIVVHCTPGIASPIDPRFLLSSTAHFCMAYLVPALTIIQPAPSNFRAGRGNVPWTERARISGSGLSRHRMKHVRR